VLGFEGDINYVGSKHGSNSAFDAGAYTGNGIFPLFHNSSGEDSYGAANVVGQTSLRWFSTFRGRLGRTFDRSLVYATGGLAVGDVQSSVSASVQHFDNNNSVFDAPFAFNGSYSGWRFGWVLGAGIEQAITDVISAKLEYLHYDLGEVSYLVTGSNGGGNLPATWTASARTSGDILRVGINFKLCNSTMSGARC